MLGLVRSAGSDSGDDADAQLNTMLEKNRRKRRRGKDGRTSTQILVTGVQVAWCCIESSGSVGGLGEQVAH